MIRIATGPRIVFFGLAFTDTFASHFFSLFVKSLNYKLGLFIRLFRTFGAFELACRASESRIKSALGGLASKSVMC